MRMKRPNSNKRGGLAVKLIHLCLLLSLVTASFGGALPGFAASEAGRGDAIDLSDYRLPDGSLPLLCLDLGGSGEPGSGGQQHCPYCRTAGDIELPAPFGVVPPAPLPRHQAWPSETLAQWRPVFLPDSPPRGPPSHRT